MTVQGGSVNMAEQTILIVEDDPDIRDGVRILLAGEG